MNVADLEPLVPHVRDLERSRRFYGEVLGWREVGRLGEAGVMYSSGRTHHELLLLQVGEEAAAVPQGRRLGLYHFGLKIGESDQELRDAKARLEAEGVRIVGKADHGVTHSLYILDPDANAVEQSLDVQPAASRVRRRQLPCSCPQS